MTWLESQKVRICSVYIWHTSSSYLWHKLSFPVISTFIILHRDRDNWLKLNHIHHFVLSLSVSVSIPRNLTITSETEGWSSCWPSWCPCPRWSRRRWPRLTAPPRMWTWPGQRASAASGRTRRRETDLTATRQPCQDASESGIKSDYTVSPDGIWDIINWFW